LELFEVSEYILCCRALYRIFLIKQTLSGLRPDRVEKANFIWDKVLNKEDCVKLVFIFARILRILQLKIKVFFYIFQRSILE